MHESLHVPLYVKRCGTIIFLPTRYNDDPSSYRRMHDVSKVTTTTTTSRLSNIYPTQSSQHNYRPTSANMSNLKLLANCGVTGFLLSTGLVMLLSPTTMAAGFGMPIQDDTFAAGFVQCMGGRNLTLGIMATIFLQRGDLRAVATMATLLAVDGLVDGLVTYKYAGVGAALPHFGAAAIIPFVSAWMSS
jgi:hypothetical protein